MSDYKSLFCDGGVILKNPSTVGGTYAYCLVYNVGIVDYGAGVITPFKMKTEEVTNNQTEMLALVRGLQSLPDDFVGVICSDSKVTLGRAFSGYRWENIPNWLHDEFIVESRRLHLHDPSKIRHRLYAGHPTKKQLEAGVGKHGLPVSEYNVWCDKACKRQAEAYIIEHGG